MRSLVMVGLFFIALTAACSRSALNSYSGGDTGGQAGAFVSDSAGGSPSSPGGTTSSIAGAPSVGGASSIPISTTDSAGGAVEGGTPTTGDTSPTGGIPPMGGTLPEGGSSGGGSGGSSIPLVGACANLTCLNPLADLMATCQTGATDTCTQSMTMGTSIVMNDCYSNGVKTQVRMGMDMASMTMTVKSGNSVCYSIVASGLLGNVMTIVVENSSGTTVATIAENTTTNLEMVTCPGGTPTVVDATCGSAPGGVGNSGMPTGANCPTGICTF